MKPGSRFDGETLRAICNKVSIRGMVKSTVIREMVHVSVVLHYHRIVFVGMLAG
jgi:hypothetical protein